MLIVPFTSDPAQTFTTNFDDVAITISARYNDRSESWTFDLTRELDQVELVAGVPLLLGQDMLAPYALKIGGMVAIDLSSAGLDAGPEDLGTRVIVIWSSEDEIAAAGAASQVPVDALSYPAIVVTVEEESAWP